MTDEQRLTEVVRSYSGKEQGPVPVNPETWGRHVAAELVDHACTLMSVDTRLTRDTLRDEAGKLKLSDRDGVRRLFVAVQMWGSGTANGRGPYNTGRALQMPDAADRLREIAEEVEAGHPGEAYNLARKGSHLTGIGPSFFTKWLWAIGSATSHDLKPLILDARVWASLGALGWSSKEAAATSDWGKRYLAYLKQMHQWADSQGPEVDPERLEWILFEWRGVTR